MILTGKSNTDFYIHLAQQGHDYIIHFDSRFLPVKLMDKLLIFPLFDRQHYIHILTDNEQQEARDIFIKIQREKGSTYIFSPELQKTYVVELIHLILKATMLRG